MVLGGFDVWYKERLARDRSIFSSRIGQKVNDNIYVFYGCQLTCVTSHAPVPRVTVFSNIRILVVATAFCLILCCWGRWGGL
jgi:hypothetical protein